MKMRIGMRIGMRLMPLLLILMMMSVARILIVLGQMAML